MGRKVGVIFNPLAGRKEHLPLIGRLLWEKLSPYAKIVTGKGAFGAEFIPKAEKKLFLEFENITEFIKGFVKECLDLGVESIVGVGGDGTMNLIATSILESDVDLPLMGIAAGTANVGPLLRFDLKELEIFDPDVSVLQKVTPLQVGLGNKHLGYAFVDMVIGDTFLGTLDGRMECLDAASLYFKNIKRIKKPEGKMKEVTLLKNGEYFTVKDVAQIIASPLHHPKFYVGKAITGSLCWAYHLGMQGVVAMTSVHIVDPYIDSETLADKEPVRVEHVLFGRKDTIRIEGLPERKFVILDGNPISPVGGKGIAIMVSLKTIKVISNRPQEMDCYPIGRK